MLGRLSASLTTALGEELVDHARSEWRRFTQLRAQAGEDLAPALKHKTARLDVRDQRLTGLDPQLPPDLGWDHHAPLRTDAKRDCLSGTCHIATLWHVVAVVANFYVRASSRRERTPSLR